MLEPKYLEDLPESVIELYGKVEQDILSDMARRLMAYDYWLDSSLWQERKLKEVGVLHDDIVTVMAGITGKSQAEIRRVMREACTRALKADGRTYAAAGLVIPGFNSSKALKNTLNAGLKATLGTFKNLTGTTANTASRQFEAALDRAWLKIKSGAFSTDTAVRDAIKELSAAGVGAITYPSGRVDTLETAVRRAIVTGVNKTAGEVQWQLADEMGCDLVQVTAHGGARPEHAAWQGGIYSRSGKSRKYKDFKETTGYGTGAGLCGWNCRHSFGPYIEGAPKAYSDKMLENYNAEKYEYNGQKMTEYEASQKQREIERNIRRWKRENKAMEAAGLDTSESAVKIRSWQEKEKDFIRQTGLKRQSVRSQVGTYSRSDAVRNGATARKMLANPQERATIKIISGARITDQYSKRAAEHAERYYDLVRSMKTDVARISKHTGLPEGTIARIKKFIFVDKHDLGNSEKERFAPDFAMAQSWQRLMNGNAEKHDMTLLYHEICEKELIEKGLSQAEAHIQASLKYNYSKEAEEYYAALKKR